MCGSPGLEDLGILVPGTRLPDPQTIEAPIRPMPVAPGLPLVDDGFEV